MAEEISGNPTGAVKEEAIKSYVRSLATEWQENNPKPKWWQFWKNSKIASAASKFMIDSVDALIVYVDDIIDNGPDKKATVLAASAALYDVVVQDILPIWLKPFAVAVKRLFVNVLLSLLIDFIVGKYKKQMWAMPPKKEQHGEENTK